VKENNILNHSLFLQTGLIRFNIVKALFSLTTLLSLQPYLITLYFFVDTITYGSHSGFILFSLFTFPWPGYSCIMEESDELLSVGAVGHSVQLESFDSEKNANDPKPNSGVIKPQDDGLGNNEEGKGELIHRATEELTDDSGMWLNHALSCHVYAVKAQSCMYINM
jgi:hypothetical protein